MENFKASLESQNKLLEEQAKDIKATMSVICASLKETLNDSLTAFQTSIKEQFKELGDEVEILRGEIETTRKSIQQTREDLQITKETISLARDAVQPAQVKQHSEKKEQRVKRNKSVILFGAPESTPEDEKVNDEAFVNKLLETVAPHLLSLPRSCYRLGQSFPALTCKPRPLKIKLATADSAKTLRTLFMDIKLASNGPVFLRRLALTTDKSRLQRARYKEMKLRRLGNLEPDKDTTETATRD